jgi:hypothetical protein
MAKEAKYGDLLADDDLKRWHDNLAAGSRITAEVYVRTLGFYCELEKTSPRQIVERVESKEFCDGFIDFVRKLEASRMCSAGNCQT